MSRRAFRKLPVAVGAGALALGACTPVPAARPVPSHPVTAVQATVSLPAAAAPSAPAAAPEEAPQPLPPAIERPAKPACSWASARWSPRAPAPLRLRPGGPMFARVSGGKVRLHLGVGAEDTAVLEAGSGGLVVTGIASRADVPLFASAAIAMNGVVYPDSRTPLLWKEGFEEGVSVTMETPLNVVVLNPPLTAKSLCGDVSLDLGARLDPAKTAFGTANGLPRVARGWRTIDVFADPAKPPTARLVLTDDVFVDAFASSGAFSRIGGRFGEVFIAGWVRTVHLRDVSGGSGSYTLGTGRSRINNAPLPALRTVVCPSDVLLVAEAGGERATAGVVLRGTSIDIVDEGEPLSQIQVYGREIQTLAAARFLARKSDLRACRAP